MSGVLYRIIEDTPVLLFHSPFNTINNVFFSKIEKLQILLLLLLLLYSISKFNEQKVLELEGAA